MPAIYLTDREEPIERDHVFVKPTGWIQAYDVEEDKSTPIGRPDVVKVHNVHLPPRRVEMVEGPATHANTGSDRVRTI